VQQRLHLLGREHNLHQDLAASADNFCRRFVGGFMEMDET
jgi:hypothetical protein